MIGEDSAWLMVSARLERTNLLVIEAQESRFALACKEVLEDNIVVSLTKGATTPQSSDTALLQQLRQSVVHLNKSCDHLLDTIVRQPHDKFGRIVCLNRPDLTSTLTLAANLRVWAKWLQPGGRIVIQTFGKDLEVDEGWMERERRYRDAIAATEFEFEQINGVQREADFLTGRIELQAYILSIKRTAQMIRSVDSGRADMLVKSAKKLRRKLAQFARRRQTAALDMLLRRPNVCGRKLFITLRLG
ncbi:hypothetical protein KCU93_g358, partial [Aureobasidium melanogenum]